MHGNFSATRSLLTTITVDRDEVERLRKRFMKLDKVREMPWIMQCNLVSS
jgi:hypothetical protein